MYKSSLKNIAKTNSPEHFLQKIIKILSKMVKLIKDLQI